MPIQVLKPVTNAQRQMSIVKSDIPLSKPSVKKLLVKKNRISGRSFGTITVRHRGGGAKKYYRVVDFDGTDKMDIPGKIVAIEYDPNRTSYIALVVYADGEKRYVLAWKGIKIGDKIVTSPKAKVKDGNRLQLQHIPVGFSVFNVEITPHKGGQAVRTAGQSAKIVSLEGDLAQVRFPSKEIRLIPKTNFATVGVVSNEEHSLEKLGKAGRVRNMGRRPQVLGKSMNPCDHPHGGGEGHNPIGLKYPKTPWGAHALGVKTRKNKVTSKFILVSRHRAKKSSS